MDVDTVLGGLYELVAPHLSEKQRRLLAGAAATALGRGGGARMARISGLSRPTVYTGMHELDDPPDPTGRVRRPGGGPKRLVERQPGLLEALDKLVDPDTRGDPESPLRWTCKSTRELADALGAQGFQVSDDTVGRLLKQQRYTLQRTQKTQEGAQHPDRDAQFGYVNQQAKAQLAAGQPVVSVDTKKKELVGNYANGGVEWQPVGAPERVLVHDFPDPAVGKAIPYGVYDLGAGAGWVSVGTDHDTAAFAVATLGRWWEQVGRAAYPAADRLLVTADAGGSNGYRLRRWKTELARFAAATGLAVTVCHFPWASRSPTRSLPRCRSSAMTGMGTGITPCSRPPRSYSANQRYRAETPNSRESVVPSVTKSVPFQVLLIKRSTENRSAPVRYSLMSFHWSAILLTPNGRG